jgi:RNA polymerase primary sigma factor
VLLYMANAMTDPEKELESQVEILRLRSKLGSDEEKEYLEPGDAEEEEEEQPAPSPASEETMVSYFREMRGISLLSPAEELRLGRRVKEAQRALSGLVLKTKSNFLPLVNLQKEIRRWRAKKKTSREPIEYIFGAMNRLAETVEGLERPQAHLVAFLSEYKRVRKELDDAVGEMVVANLRLAVNIAKRYARRGLALSDLIQEGNLGLMKAVARFDYTTGNRFSTFASWWIRQTISRALSDQGRTIRVPVHFLEARNNFYRAYFELIKELRREPGLQEVADRAQLSQERILTIIQMNREPISLQTPISDDGDLLADLVECEQSISPLEAIQDNEILDLTEAALGTLSPRERLIIAMRFGLGDEEPCTLEKVGQTLKISRERVRQLEKRALKRLRHSPQRHKLRKYVIG